MIQLTFAIKLGKKIKSRFYSVSNKEEFYNFRSCKTFGSKIKLLPPREGERFASALTNLSLSNKIFRHYGKIKLKKYIRDFHKKL